MSPRHCCPQTIDEWLADPLTREVMRADRVDPAQLRVLLQSIALRHPYSTENSLAASARHGILTEPFGWPNERHKGAALRKAAESGVPANSCGAG